MKKLLSLIIAFALFLPGGGITATATGEKIPEVLTALGIIESRSDYTKEVTRGEVARVMTKMLGAETEGEAVTGFWDVEPSHRHAKSIATLVGMGIVNGYSDGSYKPDSPVMMEEMVKLAVSVLGYDFYATYRGGYPSGYITTAYELGIFKMVGYTSGEPITWEVLNAIVYNMIDTELSVQTAFGENIEFEILPGKTLLSERLGITKGIGVVERNSVTSLSGERGLPVGQVSISEKIFHAGTTNISEHLGYLVEYYSVKEDMDEVLLYFSPEERRQTVLTIDAKDILPQTTRSTFVFENERGRTEKLNLPGGIDFVYNGKAEMSYDALDLQPQMGYVTLIDHDGDSVYDFVSVKSYENYVVKSTNLSENSIFEAYGKQYLSLDDKADPDLRYTMLRDGMSEQVAFLLPYEVLSVTKSRDGKYIHVEISNEKVSGTVTGTSDDNIIEIDGAEYKVSPDCGENIVLGDTGVFVLDIFGNVAGRDYGSSDEIVKYGYLTGAHVPDNPLSMQADFEIFDINARNFMTLSGADNLKIDSVVVKRNEIIPRLKASALASKKAEPDSVSQVVIYGLSPDGKLASLDTAVHGPGETDDRNLTLDLPYTDNEITNKRPYIGGVVGASAGTLYLQVPEDRTKKDDYEVTTGSNMSYDGRFRLEGYNLDHVLMADLILSYKEAGSAAVDDYFGLLLVDQIIEGLNSDGEQTDIISGVYRKEYKNFVVKEQKYVEQFNLKQGDIVIVNLNYREEITAIKKVYDIENPPAFSLPNSGQYVNKHVHSYGRVLSKSGNSVVIVPSEDMSGSGMAFSLSRLGLYDKAAGTVKTASIDDVKAYNDVHSISDASKLFIYTRYGVMQDAVIIKD